MQEFVDLLRIQAPKYLRWKSLSMDQETHFTYVHRAIYEGLEFIYSLEKK
jgi:hypothetical protein